MIPESPALPQACIPSSFLSPSWHPPADSGGFHFPVPGVMLSLPPASCSPKPVLQPASMLHSTGAAVTQIKQGATEDFTRKTKKQQRGIQKWLVLMSKWSVEPVLAAEPRKVRHSQKLPCKFRLRAKLYPVSSRCVEKICFFCLFAWQLHP